MNFSYEENEEIKKLKKNLTQRDLQISQLQSEGQRDKVQLAGILEESKSLKRRLDEEESKLVRLEKESAKLREERDRQKLASSNLEQSNSALREKLHLAEKLERLGSADAEREWKRRCTTVEEEADSLRARNRQLQEQLQSARSAALSTAALQQNLMRGAEVQHAGTSEQEHPSTPSTSSSFSVHGSGGGVRRSRSSSVSASASEAQRLRNALDEASGELELLRAREAKAKQEALKLYNEGMASSKSKDKEIAELTSKVQDLTDEMTFQRDHLLRDLQKEAEALRVDSSKLRNVKKDLQQSLSECSALRDQLKSEQTDHLSLQQAAQGLRIEVEREKHENTSLQKQVIAAESMSRQLHKRTRELEAARKRVKKIAASVRKMVASAGPSQTAGDETLPSGLAGVDESLSFNNTVMSESRSFDADLLDEIEQLMDLVNDADGFIEFTKVEHQMRDRAALDDIGQLQEQLVSAKAALDEMTTQAGRQADQVEHLRHREQLLEAEKGVLETKCQATANELSNCQSALTASQAQLHDLDEGVKNAEARAKELDGEMVDLRENIALLQTDGARYEERHAQSLKEVEESTSKIKALEEKKLKAEEALRIAQEAVDSERQQQKDLDNGMQVLLKERVALIARLDEKDYELQRWRERQRQEVELEKAKTETRHLREQAQHREDKHKTSQAHAAVIAQAIESAQQDTAQWVVVVHEAFDSLEKCQNDLVTSKTGWVLEVERYKEQVTSLQKEVSAALELVEAKETEFKRLHLDMEAGKANQKLAEDTLARLVPSRESDTTFNGDLSMFLSPPPSQEIGEISKSFESLKAQITRLERDSQQAQDLLEERDRQINVLQRRVELLELQLHENEDFNTEKHDSDQQMRAELNTMATTLEVMQSKLQSSEECIYSMESEKETLLEELDTLQKKLAATSEVSSELVDGRELSVAQSITTDEALRTEVGQLPEASSDVKHQLRELEQQQMHLDKTILALQRSRDQALEEHKASSSHLKKAQEFIAGLEANLFTLKEENETQRALQEDIYGELREAREGYHVLKEQLESRNTEFWDVKEELAEWQERYERSQADVKTKEDLEEKIREASEQVVVATARANAQQILCREKEAELKSVSDEAENLRSRLGGLEADFHKKDATGGAEVATLKQELASHASLIRELEYDLAQKAQECEDADDKELALRKDNKKLAARIISLQAKVEKLQLLVSAQKGVATASPPRDAPITMMPRDTILNAPISQNQAAAPQTTSRKRSAPDDEAERPHLKAGTAVPTRAIYAPKPATQISVNKKMTVAGQESSTAQTQSSPVIVQRSVPLSSMSAATASGAPRPIATRKPSISPSEQLAKRLRSPSKEAGATLQDRTNLLLPRQQQKLVAAQDATAQDNPFMAKLNRFRAPLQTHLEPTSTSTHSSHV